MWKFVLAAIFLAVPLSATAEEEEPKVVHAKRTILDFTEINVIGEAVGPEGSYVHVPPRGTFKVWIRIRDDFRPELLRSVEDL